MRERALYYLASEGVQTPSAILSDLRMGEMSGIQLAQILKGYSRFAKVPVILMSGLRPSAEFPKEVAAYLGKPIDLATLIRTIEAVTAQAQ